MSLQQDELRRQKRRLGAIQIFSLVFTNTQQLLTGHSQAGNHLE